MGLGCGHIFQFRSVNKKYADTSDWPRSPCPDVARILKLKKGVIFLNHFCEFSSNSTLDMHGHLGPVLLGYS